MLAAYDGSKYQTLMDKKEQCILASEAFKKDYDYKHPEDDITVSNYGHLCYLSHQGSEQNPCKQKNNIKS